jgi:hypothetical protein
MRGLFTAHAALPSQGYSEVAAGLEAVSEAKGALDEAKGAMLEEISATVTAITDSLRQRKAQLAPQIQALRDVRSAHQVGGSVGAGQGFATTGVYWVARAPRAQMM